MVKEVQYFKDSFEEYLGKKDHISSSDIKNFLKSPKYYYWNKYEKVEKTDGRHFAIGSALHELVLEPHLFKSNYIVIPKFDRRTKEGKANYETWVEMANGKTLLNDEEMTMIVQMAENAIKNPTFMALLENSNREVSCYTEDELTGLKLKVRPDIMPTNKSTLVDIKTCLDSSPRKFKGDVYSYGYSISAAFYMDILNRENYLFAAFEKQEPYQVSLYALNDEMIEFGREQYKMALDLLKWSYDNKYWCNYNEMEILKECYQLGNIDNFMDLKETSSIITIL